MEKKYQVFVSSTYEDLIEERKEATQALLESGCFPAGMELFPASNKKQWDIIKKVIDDCDFYLLIVAGRYGSEGIDDKGNKISYTEMEFDYALSINKPIIAFIHNKTDSIASSKVEKTQTKKNKLKKFISKVKNGRNIRYWNNKDNLKSSILSSVQALIKDEDATGWIRDNAISIESQKNTVLISELTELREIVESLTTIIKKQEQEISNLKRTNQYIFDNYLNIDIKDYQLNDEYDEDYEQQEIAYSQLLEALYNEEWTNNHTLIPRILAYKAAPKSYRFVYLNEIPKGDSASFLEDDLYFLCKLRDIEKNPAWLSLIDERIKETEHQLTMEYESLWQDSGSTID